MPAAIPIANLVVSAFSVGSQIYQGNKAERNQRSANEQRKQEAAKQQELAEMELAKSQSKKPDRVGFYSPNKGGSGNPSTLLTGPSGVDTNKLTLGKRSLLGG